MTKEFNTGRLRLLVFLGVAALHVALILLVAFRMDITETAWEPSAAVMRLLDVQEELPPPPPPPEYIPNPLHTTDSVAETVIEVDEVPPLVVDAPQQYEQIHYLPQHAISVLPLLPEDDIVSRIVYPPIAQRSNIEGTVRLELFIDRQGNIRDIRVLREMPPDRGFGEAAINAFRGIRALRPAESNGQAVAVRFQYNLRFTLR
jgi:protein TonB